MTAELRFWGKGESIRYGGVHVGVYIAIFSMM